MAYQSFEELNYHVTQTRHTSHLRFQHNNSHDTQTRHSGEGRNLSQCKI